MAKIMAQQAKSQSAIRRLSLFADGAALIGAGCVNLLLHLPDGPHSRADPPALTG
ncbi:MAG: hypothetical protein V3T27_03600 [Alphaproteobacteria bacterium]